MLEINRKRGTTLVLVTHEAELAALAERRISLRDGRIVTDNFSSGSLRPIDEIHKVEEVREVQESDLEATSL
jgi:ABC-type lipoprotein export system ATPase subunit